MVSAPPATAAAGLEALRDYDGHDAASRVKAPLLCIGADLAPLRESDLEAACPHAVYEQTLGIGHFNQLEVPDTVNEMIERFLA